MKWQKRLPAEVGWYWRRKPSDKYEFEPECIHVRQFAGELAIGNCSIRGENMRRYEWAGPIPLPAEDE
jgi:hypothetical protein